MFPKLGAMRDLMFHHRVCREAIGVKNIAATEDDEYNVDLTQRMNLADLKYSLLKGVTSFLHLRNALRRPVLYPCAFIQSHPTPCDMEPFTSLSH